MEMEEFGIFRKDYVYNWLKWHLWGSKFKEIAQIHLSHSELMFVLSLNWVKLVITLDML